jgi:hypothetical protein
MHHLPKALLNPKFPLKPLPTSLPDTQQPSIPNEDECAGQSLMIQAASPQANRHRSLLQDDSV